MTTATWRGARLVAAALAALLAAALSATPARADDADRIRLDANMTAVLGGNGLLVGFECSLIVEQDTRFLPDPLEIELDCFLESDGVRYWAPSSRLHASPATATAGAASIPVRPVQACAEARVRFVTGWETAEVCVQ
jgi:hypothetical protein